MASSIGSIVFAGHQGTVLRPAPAGETAIGCDGSVGVELDPSVTPRRSRITLVRLQATDTATGLEDAQGVQDCVLGAFSGSALISDVSERRLAVQVNGVDQIQATCECTVEALP